MADRSDSNRSRMTAGTHQQPIPQIEESTVQDDTPIAADDAYASVVAAFSDIPGVSFGSATNKGFGRDALKVDGMIFAMLVRDKLVVKLPRQRVDELIAWRQGERFDPGHGRLMREWIVAEPTSSDRWHALARESLEFVGSKR